MQRCSRIVVFGKKKQISKLEPYFWLKITNKQVILIMTPRIMVWCKLDCKHDWTASPLATHVGTQEQDPTLVIGKKYSLTVIVV